MNNDKNIVEKIWNAVWKMYLSSHNMAFIDSNAYCLQNSCFSTGLRVRMFFSLLRSSKSENLTSVPVLFWSWHWCAFFAVCMQRYTFPIYVSPTPLQKTLRTHYSFFWFLPKFPCFLVVFKASFGLYHTPLHTHLHHACWRLNVSRKSKSKARYSVLL